MRKSFFIQIFLSFSLLSSSLCFAQNIQYNVDDAIDSVAKGNPKAAILICRQILTVDVSNAKAYLVRGLAKKSIRLYKSALSDFNKSIEWDPTNGQAFYSRGFLLSELGNRNAARKDFNTAALLGIRDTRDGLTEFEPE
jgi:tetratricopeptide (TPR) repeat protein